MKNKLIIIITFSFLFFIFFIFYLSLDKEKNYNTKNLVGKKIENFELDLLFTNNKIEVNELSENNFTLINIWASWCAPCRKEHKYLIFLKDNKKLKILLIKNKDKKNNAKDFLKKLVDPYYYNAEDQSGKKSVKLGVYGIPESILINNELRIIKKYIEPINNSNYEEILDIIN